MPNPTSKLNLVVNGVTTQLDIHDANAVDLTSNQTVGGNKEFTGTTTAHDLVPSATDTYNLGTSTNKWKTLNGINPGALSLPNVADFVNVTSQVITIDGGFQFTNNLYDGWLVITAFADNVRITNQGFECRAVKSIDNAVTVNIALRLNETVYMYFTNFTNFAYVYLYKCSGNA